MIHKRIDELVLENGLDGKPIVSDVGACFKITRPVHGTEGKPSEHLMYNFRSWSDYQQANSYLTQDRTHFLDLETRGLSGRDQTWLIGILDISRSGPVVTQLLARDPTEEGSTIDTFTKYAVDRPNHISFNGKTFDSKRIVKRAEAYLLSPPKLDKGVDVYNLIRYKTPSGRRLKRVRLADLEEHFFRGFKRERHIEGRDIPEAYRRYILGGDPQPVFDAMEHNFYDLISLAALYLLALQRGF